jgi:hypothetical protein
MPQKNQLMAQGLTLSRTCKMTELKRSSKRFDFEGGSKLKGDEREEFIAGLPPRAKVLFGDFKAPRNKKAKKLDD